MKTIVAATLVTLLVALLAPDASAQSVVVQTPIPNWTRNQFITLPMVGTVSGIPTPCTWTIDSGSLPAGITLNPAGLLSGTPTTVGSSTFTLRGTVPVLGNTGTRTYTMVINEVPTFATKSLPDGALGQAYSATISIVNGTTPIAFLVTSGSVPTGLTLNLTTGALTGTPTVEGSFPFTVLATDAALATVSQAFVVNVTGPPKLEATGTTVWTVDRPGFSLDIVATAGDGTYTFDAPTGLPEGLGYSVSADRVSITGTPTAIGSATIRVRVTDGAGTATTLDTGVTINPEPRITTDALPDATAGAAYAATVEAADGAPPYSFRLTAATAGWIGIGANGMFTGTPSAAGSVDVTVEVMDASGATATKDLSVLVNAAPALAVAILDIGLPGNAYDAALPVSGGTAPFTGSILVGSLPSGLSLSGATISGTPDGAEHTEFTVRLTDRWGATADGTYFVTIGRMLPLNSNLPAGRIDARGRDAFVFDMLADTTFGVNLKVTTGMADFDARLITIDGATVDTTPYLKLSKKGVKLAKVPVPATGRYALLLTHGGEAGTIRYSGKVTGKAWKGEKRKDTFGPLSGDVPFTIPAMKGATLTVVMKAAGKDTPAPVFLDLVDPTGRPVDVGPFLKEKKGGFKIAKLVLETGGDYVLKVRPDGVGTASGVLKSAVKVKSTKVYTFSAD